MHHIFIFATYLWAPKRLTKEYPILRLVPLCRGLVPRGLLIDRRHDEKYIIFGVDKHLWVSKQD